MPKSAILRETIFLLHFAGKTGQNNHNRFGFFLEHVEFSCFLFLFVETCTEAACGSNKVDSKNSLFNAYSFWRHDEQLILDRDLMVCVSDLTFRDIFLHDSVHKFWK